MEIDEKYANAEGDYFSTQYSEVFWRLTRWSDDAYPGVARIWMNAVNGNLGETRALIDVVRNCEFDGTIEEQIITYCVMNRIGGD